MRGSVSPLIQPVRIPMREGRGFRDTAMVERIYDFQFVHLNLVKRNLFQDLQQTFSKVRFTVADLYTLSQGGEPLNKKVLDDKP